MQNSSENIMRSTPSKIKQIRLLCIARLRSGKMKMIYSEVSPSQHYQDSKAQIQCQHKRVHESYLDKTDAVSFTLNTVRFSLNASYCYFQHVTSKNRRPHTYKLFLFCFVLSVQAMCQPVYLTLLFDLLPLNKRYWHPRWY